MTRSQRGIGVRAGLLLVAAALVAGACSGPASRDDRDPTATNAAVETVEDENPEIAEATSPAATSTPRPAEEATGTPTEEPTVTPTPTEPEPTATPSPAPTATPLPVDLEASLPTAEQIPGGVFLLANQGTRSALELAEGYADSSSHLVRLDEWGFQEHHFREFSREPGGDESLPDYVLVTVNLYGSPEQADEAIAWLESLNASQGHTFVDPPPDIGDNAIASSVQTADGVPTSIIFTRYGPRVYAVFAQGGEPEAFVIDLARQVIGQLDQANL